MREGLHHLARLRGGRQLLVVVDPPQAPDSILVLLAEADGEIIPPRAEAAEWLARDFARRFLRAAGLMAARALEP